MNKAEWDAMITSMNRDYYQAQEARNRAKAIPMPENPEAWVGGYRAYAEQLPDQLPQKEVMLRHARMAQACLAEGDEDEAKFYMLMLMKNWNNAEHNKWVNGVERQLSSQGKIRAEAQRAEREPEWRRWREIDRQFCANWKGVNPPSQRQRADAVAKQTGARLETIRKRLDKIPPK